LAQNDIKPFLLKSVKTYFFKIGCSLTGLHTISPMAKTKLHLSSSRSQHMDVYNFSIRMPP